MVGGATTQEHTTLAVDDTRFNENLHSLYERRVAGAREQIERLEYERARVRGRQGLIQNIRRKVQKARINAVQAVKLRHHELVLRLDARLEQAVDEIMCAERERGEEVDQAHREAQEIMRRIEACMEAFA